MPREAINYGGSSFIKDDRRTEPGSDLRFCDSQAAAKLFVRYYNHVGREFKLRALLCRFNLDVAEENRAACFHDLGGANGAEDRKQKAVGREQKASHR